MTIQIERLRKPNIIREKLYKIQPNLILPTEAELKNLYRSKQIHNGEIIPDDINDVLVSEHALNRWNERIGPSLSDNQLTKILKQLVKIPYRITLISDEVGIIDNEIVFIYENVNDVMEIITFYGRISLVPSLQNFKKLKSYLSITSDSLNLRIDEETLSLQKPPILPKGFSYFKGKSNNYIFEYFETYNGPRAIVKKILQNNYKNNPQFKLFYFDLTDSSQSQLKTEYLYLLHSYGFSDFVTKHITIRNRFLYALMIEDLYIKEIEAQVRFDEKYNSESHSINVVNIIKCFESSQTLI